MSEASLQIACVEWFDYQFSRYKKLLWAVPNGEKRDSKTVFRKGKTVRYSPTGGKVKKMGARAGVLDLQLAIARKGFHGLFIEMKYGKGRLSPEQKEYIELLTEQGYYCVVCNELLLFKSIITNYLGENR